MTVADQSSSAIVNVGVLPETLRTPTSAAEGIFQRVTARPQGELRSYRPGGAHRSASYATLWQRSGAIVAMLERAGARPGQPVVLLADDIIDFAPGFWACLRGGFMVVALMDATRDHFHRRDSAFADMVRMLDRPMFLADDMFADLASENRQDFMGPVLRLSDATLFGGAEADIRAFDPACLIATSGSTGRPKLVSLSNAALVARNFHTIDAAAAGFPPALGIFSLDTMSGQYALYLHNESWVQIRHRDLTANPSVVLDAVEEFQIASISLTSSLVARILDRERRTPMRKKLSCLRRVGLGSEPVSARNMQEFRILLQRCGALAVDVLAGYGTTETGLLVSGSSRGLSSDPAEPPPLGHAVRGVELRIADEDGALLGEGDVGEVHARCVAKMCAGYWHDPELTRARAAGDDWWRTGDLGELRDGELILHGRMNDVLIAGGKKFSLVAIDLAIEAALGPGETAHCFVARSPEGADLLGIAIRSEGLGGDRRNALAEQMQSIALRRFGLSVAAIADVENFPLTRNGKLRRDELNQIVEQGAALSMSSETPARDGEQSAVLHLRLTEIWRDVLGVAPPVDASANFFALGGDSLRALALYTQLSKEFGIHVESDVFFADPTLAHLCVLAEAALTSPVGQDGSFWPLTAKLHRRTLAPLETWPGARPTPSRLLIGHQMDAKGAPIFWILNTRVEVDRILQAHGPARPVYVFRSGLDPADDRETTIQALALRYIEELEAVCPEGPCYIGGHCLGGLVALALAQHALRRGRHIPLLILMDWSFPLQHYGERVLLVSGRQNHAQNPRHRFALPERGWLRAFGEAEHVEISGSFAMDDQSLNELGESLNAAMVAAMSAPSLLVPESAYRATITADKAPSALKPGERQRLIARVRNDSDQRWLGWDQQGLSLGARWSGVDGVLLPRHQQHVPLPRIDPKETAAVELEVFAPSQSGSYRLHLDLCEQGNRWFHLDPARACTVLVSVARQRRVKPGAGLLARLQASMLTPAPYRFNLHSAALHLLQSGWSTPEDWGVWSVGSNATLILPAIPGWGPWRALITMKAFGKPGSDVRVALTIGHSGPTISLTLPANIIVRHEIDLPVTDEDVSIRFATPDAVSPFGIGASVDSRKLGIGLIEVGWKRGSHFRSRTLISE